MYLRFFWFAKKLAIATYTRIRIGIVHPKNDSTDVDHVLNNFSHDEKQSVEEVTTNIIESLSILIKKDLDLFSSNVNQK